MLRVTAINQEYPESMIICKEELFESFYRLTGKPRIDRTIEPSLGGIDQLFWKDSVDDRKNADAPAHNEFQTS